MEITEIGRIFKDNLKAWNSNTSYGGMYGVDYWQLESSVLNKNQQGEWEVKITSARIFQGHSLLLCWLGYGAMFATHVKVTL